MTVIHLQGDLLESDCTILGHQANAMSNLGAGIALQIAKRYPEAALADKNFKPVGKDRLGKCSVAKAKNTDRFIVNLYGQHYPGKAYSEKEQDERYVHLENAIEKMLKSLPSLRERNFRVKVGLPFLIGCDLAGGDWKIVYNMIEKLSNKYSEDIYLYELKKKKRNF